MVENKSAILALVSLLFVVSCGFMNKSVVSRVSERCGSFKVVFSGTEASDALFHSKIKKFLEDKFRLYFNNVNGDICTVTINNVAKKTNTSIVSTSGVTSRVNNRIIVNYSVNAGKVTKNSSCNIVYDNEVSENYYSQYVNDIKISDNNVE